MSGAGSKGTRKPNGASTIYYSEYDGCWHGRVTVGVKDNGTPDRRHVKRKATGRDDKKAKNAVREAVRKLERERETGTVRKAGRAMLVEEWLVGALAGEHRAADAQVQGVPRLPHGRAPPPDSRAGQAPNGPAAQAGTL